VWDYDNKNKLLEAASGHQRFPQREISQSIELASEVSRKPVSYVLVPNQEIQLEGDQARQSFIMRIYSSNPIELVQLPEVLNYEFSSQWTPSNAGGKMLDQQGIHNPLWGKNP